MINSQLVPYYQWALLHRLFLWDPVELNMATDVNLATNFTRLQQKRETFCFYIKGNQDNKCTTPPYLATVLSGRTRYTNSAC